jgi:hypothetical protein
MLSFGDRGAAIVEAETMIHARLRVAVNGLVRASSFIGGCQIDPEFIPLIPGESIGRKLSREQSSELLELLKHGPPRRSAKPGRAAISPPPIQMLALPGPQNSNPQAHTRTPGWPGETDGRKAPPTSRFFG